MDSIKSRNIDGVNNVSLNSNTSRNINSRKMSSNVKAANDIANIQKAISQKPSSSNSSSGSNAVKTAGNSGNGSGNANVGTNKAPTVNNINSLANSAKNTKAKNNVTQMGLVDRMRDFSSNLNLGNVILALFFIYLLVNLVYITSETYRVGSTIVELNKYMLNNAIDYRYLYQEGRQEKLFKNFYVATAFRPYLAKNQLLDYASDRILLQTIKCGPRALFVDIFNDTLSDDAFPVVSSGFEKGNWRLTLSTLSFDKFCQTLAKSIFTSGYVNNYDDPFILVLNLKTNHNFKCHNRIQETLFKYFKARLLPSKFSYGKGDLLNTPMKELMGKIIIMTSGGYENSKLEELVNFSLERDDFHKISFKTLVDEVSSSDNVKLNMDDVRTQMRDNLALIVPEENGFFTRNYNPQNFFDTGCQMIAMNYQKVDKYMEQYYTRFQQSSFVEKPKGLQSLA